MDAYKIMKGKSNDKDKTYDKKFWEELIRLLSLHKSLI
jgi:hypothetical protein